MNELSQHKPINDIASCKKFLDINYIQQEPSDILEIASQYIKKIYPYISKYLIKHQRITSLAQIKFPSRITLEELSKICALYNLTFKDFMKNIKLTAKQRAKLLIFEYHFILNQILQDEEFQIITGINIENIHINSMEESNNETRIDDGNINNHIKIRDFGNIKLDLPKEHIFSIEIEELISLLADNLLSCKNETNINILTSKSISYLQMSKILLFIYIAGRNSDNCLFFIEIIQSVLENKIPYLVQTEEFKNKFRSMKNMSPLFPKNIPSIQYLRKELSLYIKSNPENRLKALDIPNCIHKMHSELGFPQLLLPIAQNLYIQNTQIIQKMNRTKYIIPDEFIVLAILFITFKLNYSFKSNLYSDNSKIIPQFNEIQDKMGYLRDILDKRGDKYYISDEILHLYIYLPSLKEILKVISAKINTLRKVSNPLGIEDIGEMSEQDIDKYLSSLEDNNLYNWNINKEEYETSLKTQNMCELFAQLSADYTMNNEYNTPHIPHDNLTQFECFLESTPDISIPIPHNTAEIPFEKVYDKSGSILHQIKHNSKYISNTQIIYEENLFRFPCEEYVINNSDIEPSFEQLYFLTLLSKYIGEPINPLLRVIAYLEKRIFNI